ncbi:MAG: ATP-binding protein [bacterium]
MLWRAATNALSSANHTDPFSPMHRSLHFRLIAIVVTTVTAVLVTSQAIDTHLTARAINQDRRERAALVLRAVDSMWDSAPPAVLRDRLSTLVYGDPEVTAIDVFRLDGNRAIADASTRPSDEVAAATPSDEQIAALRRDERLNRPVTLLATSDSWRLSLPLSRGGAVVGAAQVDVHGAEEQRLVARIRLVDAMELVGSIVLISLVLTRFLARRVTQPIDALVEGMRRVERGDLAARVTSHTDGELRFLSQRFNAMVARLQALTSDLGAQVRRATESLAERNTQLQAANDSLWETQLELGRGERLAALGQMAGTLAHELGTPLNSVLGYVQLLQHDTLSAPQHEKLGIVESQLRRMIDEIRSILERTRDVPLRRSPVEIGALVADATAVVAARLAARHITLATDVPANLPRLPADAVGLRQVLLNLLFNAIDATPEHGVIRVSAARHVGDGRRPEVELAVVDSGPGMLPDEVQRAFEPFYTTKGPGRGTGLGLVIVEHIVRAHGGQIVAESAPGHGTAMRVRLPLEV